MRNLNDTRKGPRRQDVYVAALASLLAFACALDPDAHALPAPARYAGLAAATGLWTFFFFRRLAGFLGKADAQARVVRATLAGVLIVNVLSTLYFFPPRDLFNDRPVLSLDHSFHFYQAVRASDFVLQSGRLHCYDRFHMAGYPTVIFDLDMKAAELFCAPFRRGGAVWALKLFILFCYTGIVWTVYRGGRLLGFSPLEAFMGLALFLAFWHFGRPLASHFRYAGMFSFVLASHLSLLVSGLFRRFLRGEGYAAFIVLGSLAFLVHPTSVVLLAAPFLVLIVGERRSLHLRRAAEFTLWCLIVIVVNAVWIVPLLRYADIKTRSSAYFQTAGLSGIAAVLLRPGCLLALALVALGLLGAVSLVRERRTQACLVTVGTAGFLAALAAFGIHMPGVRHLEPGRFLLPSLVFLAPAAGAGLARALRAAAGRLGVELARERLTRRAAAVLLASPLALSMASAYAFYEHRITTTPSAEVQRLIDAIRTHVNGAGRLLIEDGPARLYDDAHLPGVLPLLVRAEQIGGPYPHTFVRHHHATFQLDNAMGVPMDSLPPSRFWQNVELYNVLWIVTATAQARAYVGSLQTIAPAEAPPSLNSAPRPELERVWESRRYTLWRVIRSPSYSDPAGTSVEARIDRIVVQTLGADSVFVRYHWDRGFRVSPPAEIDPVRRLDDPVPFILVKPHGEREVVIRYAW